MADKNVKKSFQAERRRRRVRGKIAGTGLRPRMTVNKSLKNLRVQLIDDDKRVTLIGLATNSKVMLEAAEASDTKVVVAKKIGMKMAELAKSQGIETVVFDRNSCRYHGRIKAVADGAREGGLKL